MPEYRVLPAGDTALVVEFGERIDRRLSTWVLALAQRLNAARLNGIIETVPTFRSLMVHYDPLALSSAALTARIVELMRGLETAGVAGRHWRLPACYDPQVAPDLDETRRAHRPVAGATHRAAQRGHLSRLHARLPAGLRLSG